MSVQCLSGNGELGDLFRHVLLVEDDTIIAMDIEALVTELGAERVTIAARVRDALDALSEIFGSPPSLAVLDVKLEGETSFPIADQLNERQIPFVFATGYSHQGDFPERFRSIPCVTKPFTSETLKKVICGLR
ncbi:MAG: response regulator [Alphaproteobacteria bacterium]|nr:response regulator [Alphaproteobacteria bacterium]